MQLKYCKTCHFSIFTHLTWQTVKQQAILARGFKLICLTATQSLNSASCFSALLNPLLLFSLSSFPFFYHCFSLLVRDSRDRKWGGLIHWGARSARWAPNPPFFLSPRSPRSAMLQQHQNWATTAAMTSSPAWCRPTPTRPRPWWTLSPRWSGTTCPRSPQRATTERAEWRPSSRSPEKLVGTLSFLLIPRTLAHQCSSLLGPPAVMYWSCKVCYKIDICNPRLH